MIFCVKIVLGGSANLTKGSAEPARPKFAEDSAEPTRLGRSLVFTNNNCTQILLKVARTVVANNLFVDQHWHCQICINEKGGRKKAAAAHYMKKKATKGQLS